MVAGGRRQTPSERLDVDRVFSRMDEKLDAQAGRLERAIEGIAETVHTLRIEVQKEGLERRNLDSGFIELTRQVNDTREQLQRLKSEQTKAAASGAAEGAAKGAAEGLAPAVQRAAQVGHKTLINAALGTWQGRTISFAAAISGIAAGIDGVPKIVKALAAFWVFLEKLGK